MIVLALRVWSCLLVAASAYLWAVGLLFWPLALFVASVAWAAYVETTYRNEVKWVSDV